jgi:hypothetical protein
MYFGTIQLTKETIGNTRKNVNVCGSGAAPLKQ